MLLTNIKNDFIIKKSLEFCCFRYIIDFMSDYLDPNNEELLKDFFAEAEQQVEQLESNILVIESDPSNRDAIDEIFRAAHTLKGGSATVEMTELSHFTHSVEDVLDEIRSDRVKIDEDVVDLLLSSIDVIKAMLDAKKNGDVYDEDIEVIITIQNGNCFEYIIRTLEYKLWYLKNVTYINKVKDMKVDYISDKLQEDYGVRIVKDK